MRDCGSSWDDSKNAFMFHLFDFFLHLLLRLLFGNKDSLFILCQNITSFNKMLRE